MSHSKHSTHILKARQKKIIKREKEAKVGNAAIHNTDYYIIAHMEEPGGSVRLPKIQS